MRCSISLPIRPAIRSLTLLLLSSLPTGCSKFTLLDATIPSDKYTLQSNLTYGPLPQEKLDVYHPKSPNPAGDIVIFIHGGSWQSGTKVDYRFVADALTANGFIAVFPDYREYPQVQFPAFMHDAAASVRWVHDHATEIGGNPNHIFLMGHSAGGHIVALLSLDEEYLKEVGLDHTAIRATAALSGPYDFVPLPDELPVFGMTSRSQTPSPEIEPMHYANAKSPPLLLVHGSDDPIVNVGNAKRLAAAIKSAGGDVTLLIYPRTDHIAVVLSFAWEFRWLAPTLKDVTAFFRRHE